MWERVKKMIGRLIKSQGIVIREPVSFETNVLRNRVWYRGDASELEQLFRALGDDSVGRARFWASAPVRESLRKAHSGLPGILVDTLAGIVKSDFGGLAFEDVGAAAMWAKIARENDFPSLLSRAVAETLVTGDGAFKISFDERVSPLPLLSFHGADEVEYLRRRGRIVGVAFLTQRGKRTLKEIYEPGSIRYELWEGDRQIPPDDPELHDVTFDPGMFLAVPLQFWPSARWEGRGQSIFDRKTDAFDAHDEIISQWLDAVRAGRVQNYIPESLIPRDPHTGALKMPDSFGSRFIATGGGGMEGAADKIETVQPEIRYDAFLASYQATLDLCLQGILSPATLGINVGRMASAEAQRERKDVTGFTRMAITDALEKALPALASAALELRSWTHAIEPEPVAATVSFGEYGAPDFDSRVRTVAAAATAGIMSREAQVEELWGASKDEDWKAAEVSRLKEVTE